jgi:hypothetical protein
MEAVALSSDLRTPLVVSTEAQSADADLHARLGEPPSAAVV